MVAAVDLLASKNAVRSGTPKQVRVELEARRVHLRSQGGRGWALWLRTFACLAPTPTLLVTRISSGDYEGARLAKALVQNEMSGRPSTCFNSVS